MRRGSLEFRPHRRAQNILPRMRTWPRLAMPAFSSLLAFKAGMTHVSIIDDSESPSKGQEITRAATILAFPRTLIYGIKLYKKNYIYNQSSIVVYDKSLAHKAGIKNAKNTSLEEVKKKIDEFTDVTALALADPSNLKIGIKRQIRFEIPIGGETPEQKLVFLENWFGKEIKPSDVLSTGEFLDVSGISKSKGWQGVVKRFGVAKQFHKATGKIRHVGTLGAWHPPKVLFTVSQAGQMGFNYRTELNKKILKMGSEQEADSINARGGFLNFGNIRGDFILIDGSIPGPAKRLVRVRKAVRAKRKGTAPKITYVSTTSKQGA
jgi:large subunit ribosomal protein L3